MATAYSYACKDYPGMEACPGKVVAETEEEVWKLMELHASVAHDEDPRACCATCRRAPLPWYRPHPPAS